MSNDEDDIWCVSIQHDKLGSQSRAHVWVTADSADEAITAAWSQLWPMNAGQVVSVRNYSQIHNGNKPPWWTD